MKKIACSECVHHAPGGICDWPPEAMEDFRNTGSTILYKPRQVIFSEGGPCQGLYILCAGMVKLYHSDRFGRDHILEVAAPGALLGELPAEEGQTLSISAEALTEAQLSYLPRERLTRFIQKHPDTAMRMIGALSVELAAARRKARDLALKGAESRMAGLLLRLASADGGMTRGQRLRLPYTRQEMAEMIGVSTETAIRLLTRLREKSVIDATNRELVIRDVDRLQRIAGYGEIAN